MTARTRHGPRGSTRVDAHSRRDYHTASTERRDATRTTTRHSRARDDTNEPHDNDATQLLSKTKSSQSAGQERAGTSPRPDVARSARAVIARALRGPEVSPRVLVEAEDVELVAHVGRVAPHCRARRAAHGLHLLA